MQRNKSVINKLLGKYGFELRPCARSIQDLNAYPKTETSGWIVEIIGTQAVGKSTLNNAIHKHLRARWFFREDLEYTGASVVHSDAIETLHRKIFFRRIAREGKSQSDAWKSIRVSRQKSVVMEQSMTMSLNTFPRGFILNEGLFKGFPEEILELDPSESRPLWKNRAFVYMRARDLEVAVSRYQGRVAKRLNRGLFLQPQTDEEVRRRVERDNMLFDRLYERAQSIGCPAITVYAEDDLESTVKRVLDFEKSLPALG